MKNIFTVTGLYWVWLTCIVFLLDFSSKQWIIKHFNIGESKTIIPLINVTYVHNPGAAFSFLANQNGWQYWLFLISTVIITVILFINMFYSNANLSPSNIAYAIIIGGSLGNSLDRIMYNGMVIDFIDLYVGNWHWPTFNIADCCIFIGTLFIILDR